MSWVAAYDAPMPGSVASVCVFCGSGMGTSPAFRAAAEDLGTHLGSEGVRLVYGGASVGLMGVVADAALAAGAEVIGVIPAALRDREIAHPGLSELHVVDDMHQRKRRMYDLADGFCALPGGYGTLDEVFEAVTWSQLGLHAAGRVKPVVLLEVDDYWRPLVGFLDAAVDSGFVRPHGRSLVSSVAGPAAMIEAIGQATAVEDRR